MIFLYILFDDILMLVRNAFKEKANSVDVRDTYTIETLLARGRRQLKLLQLPGTDGYATFTMKPP
jgi:hypothetical protein